MSESVKTAAADVKAAATADVTKEVSFFETHPKATAIGAASATAAIFLVLHFVFHIL